MSAVTWPMWAVFGTGMAVLCQTLYKLASVKFSLGQMLTSTGLMIFLAGVTVHLLSEQYGTLSWNKPTVLAALGLGLAEAAIIGSFYMLYASGAPISIARPIMMGATAVGLVVVGYLFFAETINAKQLTGIFMAIAAIYLMAQKA